MAVERKLARRVAKVLAPPPDLTVSQWADQERFLSPESSAERGKWDTNRAPFQRDPMDAASDPEVTELVLMMSAQVGKTELTLNLIGYHIHYDPSPILLVQSSLELAEAYSKDRLAPMIRDTPALAEKIKDPRSRDSGNTLLHKKFTGGQLTMAGANSPSSLASRPVRLVICDEVDRFPFSAGTEGDPVNLAQARAETFYNRKFVLTSTPTIDGHSRIQRAYERSDKRRYHVPCPLCEKKQGLTWPQVKFDQDEAGDPINVRYQCVHCDGEFDDSRKDWMLLNGEWIAEAPFRGVAGFHISALYSPWKRWEELAREWVKAQGDPEALKVFINTKLGETWKEKGDAPDWERLYLLRESYKQGTIPSSRIDLLTAGVDVQKDRIEVQVVGWAKNKENWSIDHIVLYGDPTSESNPIWSELDEVLGRTYLREETGELYPVAAMGVDTGFATQAVYSWVRRHAQSRVFAIKGKDSLHQAFAPPKLVDVTTQGRKIRRGMQLWNVGVSLLKSEIYSWLRLRKAEDDADYPAGYCHHPEYPEEYFRQLTAEQIVRKATRRGYARAHWEKTRERNEALDTMVYARAAAAILGIDHMTETKWERSLTKFRNVAISPREKKPAARKPRKSWRDEPDWL